MNRRTGIIFGSVLTALCFAGCAAGIAFLVLAHGMPAHTDEARATELTDQYEQKYLDGTPEQKASIEQQISSLRTSKWRLFNAGIVMLLSGSTLLVAIVRFRLWDIRRMRSVTTPRTRLRLLALSSGAWLALLPAVIWELDREYDQDDLIPNIDTGHGIMFLIGPPYFAVICIIMLLIGRFVILRKSSLPANLWCWDSERPNHSLAWTLLYGLLGGAFILLTGYAVEAFPWALPSLMVGLYVIASTRAALLSRAQM